MKFYKLAKDYPIPLLAVCGILTGTIARFFFSSPETASAIWLITLVLGGAPIAYKTVRGMFQGHFASDIVAMLAILTALAMNQAFAGCVVVLMQSGGEALESFGLRRASSSLSALLARAPRSARRKEGDSIKEIDVAEIRVGDKLVVRQGDLIPVDGTITEGRVEIDEAAITGEPLAHVKGAGQLVLSGSVAVSGAFEMRADKISQESQYAKIVELVRKAQAEKAPIERLADRYAIFFTPLTLLMSAIGYFITGEPTTILSVLVVATPCPLILATPVAIISGINRAARAGIIVKGGAPIEQVGRTNAAIFDKTGTITHGEPFVERLIAVNAVIEDELLFKAASVEQLSSHSVAQSIVRAALEKFKSLPIPSNFREMPGCGVEADVDGQRVMVGSSAYLQKSIGSDFLNHHKALLEKSTIKGSLASFIAVEGKFVGIIVLSDRIRPGVPQMMQKLADLGVQKTVMLTGDSSINAHVVADQAGIKHVKAELLPEQKVAAVKELLAHYSHTLMVGDGINDAPALATATVGIAMGAKGTGISAEAADIVLLVDDVTKVSEAIMIGQRTLRVARESIYIGMGLSFVLMVIAALGYIPPVIGALLQEVIDAAVILNALRAR